MNVFSFFLDKRNVEMGSLVLYIPTVLFYSCNMQISLNNCHWNLNGPKKKL